MTTNTTKKIKRVLALLLLILSPVYAQSTALQYLDNFGKLYKPVKKDMWDYTRSVSHGKSARVVEKRRLDLIESSKESLRNAKDMDDFEGNTSLRDSVVAYFNLVNLVLKEDYAEIVDMEAVAEESYDLMEAYLLARERANDKLENAAKVMDDEYRKFAADNNITLIESDDDKIGDKMKIAEAVYDHYNEVYLIFFKSYKQELYVLDAMNKKDVNAMEQNRNALKTTAEEGLDKLKNTTPYEGDDAMIDATEDLLKFYIKEAEKEFTKLTDYYLKNENFEKIKEAFDNKKEKDRTQDDVDEYNGALKELNEAIEDFNEINKKINDERAKLLDNWNKVAAKYTDKYVPRGS